MIDTHVLNRGPMDRLLAPWTLVGYGPLRRAALDCGAAAPNMGKPSPANASKALTDRRLRRLFRQGAS